MEFETVNVDGTDYDYILSSDDEIETNDIDIEDTIDLTMVIQNIQGNSWDVR